MFLPLYTLAAIANIFAKSHNFNINHELHPYLRVRRSIGSVEFSDVKPNEIETEPDYNLEGDIDVNWLGVEDPANPLEADKAHLSSGKQDSDGSGVLRIPNEETYKQKYAAVIFHDAVNTPNGALHDQREKRSLYLPVPMPVFNEAKPTTTQVNRTIFDVSNTTEYDSSTPSTQRPLFDTDKDSDYDYDNSDYENGGHFIARRPITVDISTNKTESYDPSSEVNWTKNRTQAYYPLSHTYIPGYNKPDDVFNFEKGPVYTNATNNSKENKTSILDNISTNASNRQKVDANSTDSNNNSKRIKNYNRKDSLNFKGTNSKSNTKNEEENNFEDENNARRVKRSYYVAVPHRGKAGQAQSYYPLSHTYIPGYNNQEDVFEFEGGAVVPVPNKKNPTPNKPKGNNPKEGDNPVQSNKKNVKKSEATTKRTTPKNQQRTTSRPQNVNKRTPKIQVTPKPSHSRPTIGTRMNQKPDDDSDYSLDYENNGEFIVHNNRNRGRPMQKNQPKPNNNRPQLSKNIRQGQTTRKTKDSDEEDVYDVEEDYRTRKVRKHSIARQKRSYYMPIYGTDSNGRKKITGYHPLSHTSIPGYNEQDDVWNFEGGKVYPYPSNRGGDEDTYGYTELPNSHRKGNENQKPTKDENDKHESLLDKLLINPLKKLFGKRKKRSIDTIQKYDTKIVQKRDSITDFLNNMIEKIENYTRRDQVVVIDISNASTTTSPNEINYVSDAYGNGINGRNTYNGDASSYNQNNYKQNMGNYQETGYNEQLYQNYPQNNYKTPYNYQNGYSPYASGYQSRYYNQGAYNISNNVYPTDNVNINDNNYLPQSVSGGSEESDPAKGRNLSLSCFLCRSSRCPVNYKRVGPTCVRIK